MWVEILLSTLLLAYCADLGYSTKIEYRESKRWQEQFIKRNLPAFVPRQTAEHILQLSRWREYERFTGSARKVSESMYRKYEVTEEDMTTKMSPICQKHIQQITVDTFLRKTYALYIQDSSGRENSGLFVGDYLWLGNYYECKGQTDGGDIVTKGCLVVIGDKRNTTDGLYLMTCFPDTCSENDVNIYMESLLSDGEYSTATCSEDTPYSGADIAAISILSILAFSVFVGTTCETIFICMDLHYKGRNARHNAMKQSAPAYILLCFSIIKNTKTLFNTKRKESTIPVLDGIRFLSMAWVILGHTVYFAIGSMNNALDVGNFYLNHWGAQVIVNGTFSVDSFFFLSGLLVTYLTLREMKRSGYLNVPVMYLHRYLRLTPTLIVVMLFTSTLFMRIGEVPLFEIRYSVLSELCQRYWWTNILYINNLYPNNFNEGCISWVWYLANDWQFFVVSPIFIYLLYRYPIPGLIASGSVAIASIIMTGVLAQHYDAMPDVYFYSLLIRYLLFIFTPGLGAAGMGELSYDSPYAATTPKQEMMTTIAAEEDERDYMADIYARPWCRIGAYMIGMITGYVLYATNKKIKMRLVYITTLWAAAFALAFALIYSWWGVVSQPDFDNLPSYDIQAFYEAVKRPLWALALMWLTLACSAGYGGPIDTVLSWKVFMPLSRLTFCAYLLHPLVMFYMFASVEKEPHFRVNTFIYYYLAALVLSYSAAYIMSMIVEAPLSGLQKIIFYVPKHGKAWYAKFAIKIQDTEVVSSTSHWDNERGHEMGIENEIELQDEADCEKSSKEVHKL